MSLIEESNNDGIKSKNRDPGWLTMSDKEIYFLLRIVIRAQTNLFAIKGRQSNDGN